ncbi:hypothetical protein OG611_24635 [Streptomyces sp. NBC_01363]|nr:hypothetical protein [Streptomyces sp. NBC_01363]MCX4734110.1 hypothetical protein [Streptomyces sp. NBC_01363]
MVAKYENRHRSGLQVGHEPVELGTGQVAAVSALYTGVQNRQRDTRQLDPEIVGISCAAVEGLVIPSDCEQSAIERGAIVILERFEFNILCGIRYISLHDHGGWGDLLYFMNG